MDRDKLMKMATSVRTGGKGSMRRKKKTVHKAICANGRKIHDTLKSIGAKRIESVEEVHIFKDDVVLHFIRPTVKVCGHANTWAVNGKPQTKRFKDILPGILDQLGIGNDVVPELVAGETFENVAHDDDDDDAPELSSGETFESAAA